MKYEYEREEAGAGTKLTYLLIGGGIGAMLALLFAPKSGVELRGDIADATRKGVEKGKETASLVGEKANEYYEVSRDKAGELYDAAQEKAGEIYSTATEKASGLFDSAQSKVSELTDKAKDATGGGNPISEAIEAGKEAYKEEKHKLESKTASANSSHKSDDKILELPKETNS